MIDIGTFEVVDDGFKGRIRTLCLDAEIVVHALRSHDRAISGYDVRLGPDAFGTRIGCGVSRVNGALGPCIELLLDDPSFAAPIRATLYPSLLGGGRHDLFWSKPSGRWKIE
ncbi:DUF736 domain-containing protein [Sphingobium sp. TKS]|uniref:DUF736 domain-containing protein n=1 Tax=Sphingobium sp. TKS TaxID=1315974 RepID=UPI0007704734|nr:DUF736 family protein [Sphingobium sp. TKS]AMK21946.1 hypothetical protein K426_04965 [Sphingobium sp. TKS]